MKHEIDRITHTFYRSPVTKERLFTHVRSFHPGVYDDGQNSFNILLLGGAEAKCIKRSGYIPISDITDPDVQLHVQGLATLKAEDRKDVLPTCFVQDTPVAREILAKGNFPEEKPSYRVVPDPVASLMI